MKKLFILFYFCLVTILSFGQHGNFTDLRLINGNSTLAGTTNATIYYDIPLSTVRIFQNNLWTIPLTDVKNLSELASPTTALTNLGGTTVGKNFFTLTNPSAITFPRINADNTVSARTAAQMLGDLGAITNTAANNEIPKSNGTNIVPSGLFSSVSGNLDLGLTSLAGDRTISAKSSSANNNLYFQTTNGSSTATNALQLFISGTKTVLVGSPGNLSFNGSSYAGRMLIGSAFGFDFTNYPGQLSLVAATNSSSPSGVLYPFRVINTPSSGTPSTGFGAGIEFGVSNAAVSVNLIAATVGAESTGMGAGVENFDIVFRSMTGGAVASEKLRINSSGAIGLSGANYGTAGQTQISGGSGAAVSWGTVGPSGLTNTAVTPGSYTNSNITVDAQGRLTAASNGSGGAPFADNVALIKGFSDATKLLILSASSITTGTTRTWTFPDVNGTVARNDAAQTFTGVQTFTGSPVMSAGITGGTSSGGNLLISSTTNATKGFINMDSPLGNTYTGATAYTGLTSKTPLFQTGQQVNGGGWIVINTAGSSYTAGTYTITIPYTSGTVATALSCYVTVSAGAVVSPIYWLSGGVGADGTTRWNYSGTLGGTGSGLTVKTGTDLRSTIGQFQTTVYSGFTNIDNQIDNVWQLGYNQDGTGGKTNPSEAEFHIAIENHYIGGGTSTNGDIELHFEGTTRSGLKNRYYSINVRKDDGLGTGFSQLTKFDWRASNTSTPYFLINSTGTSSHSPISGDFKFTNQGATPGVVSIGTDNGGNSYLNNSGTGYMTMGGWIMLNPIASGTMINLSSTNGAYGMQMNGTSPGQYNPLAITISAPTGSYTSTNNTSAVSTADAVFSTISNGGDAINIFDAGGASNRWVVGGDVSDAGNLKIGTVSGFGSGVVMTFVRSTGNIGFGKTPVSTLDISGSLGLKGNAISTDLTLDATYYEVYVDASGGNRVETLPAAASSIGRVYVIKKGDSSVNSVTIDGNASETIDGALTKVVNTQYSGWQIHVNAAGTAWNITATF